MDYTYGADPVVALERAKADLFTLSQSVADLVERDFDGEPHELDVQLGRINRITSHALSLTTRIIGLTSGIGVPPGEEPMDSARKMELTRDCHQTSSWLRQWSNVEAMLRLQAKRKRVKLYPPAQDAGKALSNQLKLYDDMFDLAHKLLSPAKQSKEARRSGAFPDIALPHSLFIAHLHAAYRVLLAMGKAPETAMFLDVGCGSGIKVIAAARLFGKCYGLELDPGYAELARGMLGQVDIPASHVLEGNALEFASYDRFDVIYAYRPLSSNDLMRELEARISSGAEGAILIAPYQFFASRAEALDCARIDGQIYLVGGSKRRAQQLRRKAELIGPHVSSYQPTFIGAWDPILLASFRKGFVVSPQISTTA